MLWFTGSLDLSAIVELARIASTCGSKTHLFWSKTTLVVAAAFLASSLTLVGLFRKTSTFLTPLVPSSTTSRSENRGASLEQMSGSLAALPFSKRTLGAGGSPAKVTWPLRVPKPSALTGAAAAGVVAAEGALDPGAAAAEVLAAGLELTVEGATTASLESVPWPPQPKTEAIKVTPRLRPRVAGLRIQLVIIAILPLFFTQLLGIRQIRGPETEPAFPSPRRSGEGVRLTDRRSMPVPSQTPRGQARSSYGRRILSTSHSAAPVGLVAAAVAGWAAGALAPASCCSTTLV